MTNLVVAGLHHDAEAKRSIVYVRWENDPEKRLGLVVPFGCSMDTVDEEATRALKALSEELAAATVKWPWKS